MALPIKKITAALVILLFLTAIVPLGLVVVNAGPSDTDLPGWEIKFERSAIGDITKAEMIPQEEWIQVNSHEKRPETPLGMTSAWVRFSLGHVNDHSAVLIDKVYGNHIKAFLHNSLVYDSLDKVNYSGSKVLIPLSKLNEGEQLYLWTNGGGQALGIEGSIKVGSYAHLLSIYVKQGLIDLVIGGTFIFIAIVLLICSLFLKRGFFQGGISLILVILSIGILVVTYSSFLPVIIGNYGGVGELLFGLALYTLLPSFTFYFEKIFGPGRKRIITRFRKFQIGYSVLCGTLMIVNELMSDKFFELSKYLSVNILGIIMILQFFLLLSMVLINVYHRNIDAIIFCTGFLVFSLLSLTELVLYYITRGGYHLFLWKWGMVAFVISLIIILGRKFSKNHEQLIEYSRKLEKFNNDLQRSEKIEMISELAASVAHEVRNPLQVTRGFLQILGERSDNKEKEYLNMAVAELDRATLIITDFLTFAKPGLEAVEVLDVSEELKHVAGIMVPLASLQGGVIDLKLEQGLYAVGSSPKFKQAFINIIKNSIEALQENGRIEVSAWKSENDIVISVRDNGEGMKASEIARLGEPYYSNKTKGTGLGLMVTLRIIEAMKGTTVFHSEKGVGTEIIIKIPQTEI